LVPGDLRRRRRAHVDLIRGRSVDEAIATRASPKVGRWVAGPRPARNARQRKPELDVDRLFVHTAFVDGGRPEAHPAGPDGARVPVQRMFT
jgi:hypothetical protein